MKSVKKSLVYIMMFILLLTAVGCSSKPKTGPTETPNPQVIEGNKVDERPEGTPDLEGKVKQIRGNEITLLKVIRTRAELTEEEKAKRRQQMMNLSPEERAKLQAEMFKVTDESIDVIIPVGVPIVSNQNAGGKLVTESVSLSEIRQGNIVRFWFAEGSPDEIIHVQVMRTGQ